MHIVTAKTVLPVVTGNHALLDPVQPLLGADPNLAVCVFGDGGDTCVTQSSFRRVARPFARVVVSLLYSPKPASHPQIAPATDK